MKKYISISIISAGLVMSGFAMAGGGAGKGKGNNNSHNKFKACENQPNQKQGKRPKHCRLIWVPGPANT